MNFLQVQSEQPNIQPETLFEVGAFTITNAHMMSYLVIILVTLFVLVVKMTLQSVPKRSQAILEMAVEGFIGLLDQITNDDRISRRLLPLIGTLFIYIGLSNFIGLFPGITSITYEGTALFRTPTNDFNLTFSIALAMVIYTQLASIKKFGVFTHLGKYFQFGGVIRGFKKGIGAGFLSIIDFLIGLLDIISEFAKVLSLSLRLFGNMYAGEVLAVVLFGAIAVIAPAPWLAMNMLVAVLQALVFGSLTAAYYTLAISEPEQELQ
jgi:F-type H+-transporting ATPase subunit a